jgi:hypothetical protein
VFRRHQPSSAAARDTAAEWEAAVIASGLPVVLSGARGSGSRAARPRILFAASLPPLAEADAELADLLLYETRPVWDVRDRLRHHLPAGTELVDLHDVWLGEPALPSIVVAADWRVTLEDSPSAEQLTAAAGSLLASPTLPRPRLRGGATSTYDLRPLVGDVTVEGVRPVVLIRTLFHPERGVGRPEEVVDALAGLLGRPLAIERLIRLRLVLDENARTRGGHAAAGRGVGPAALQPRRTLSGHQPAPTAASRRGRNQSQPSA